MPNLISINAETAVNGVCHNHDELPPTDGLFVGHRFIGQELEVLIGQKIGTEYQMAVVLDAHDAQLLVNRIQTVLEATDHGQEPVYQHPVAFQFNADGEIQDQPIGLDEEGHNA